MWNIYKFDTRVAKARLNRMEDDLSRKETMFLTVYRVKIIIIIIIIIIVNPSIETLIFKKKKKKNVFFSMNFEMEKNFMDIEV